MTSQGIRLAVRRQTLILPNSTLAFHAARTSSSLPLALSTCSVPAQNDIATVLSVTPSMHIGDCSSSLFSNASASSSPVYSLSAADARRHPNRSMHFVLHPVLPPLVTRFLPLGCVSFLLRLCRSLSSQLYTHGFAYHRCGVLPWRIRVDSQVFQ